MCVISGLDVMESICCFVLGWSGSSTSVLKACPTLLIADSMFVRRSVWSVLKSRWSVARMEVESGEWKEESGD